jgi:cobaltochelatase CobN
MKKIFVVLAITVITSGIWLWDKKIAPTKVALISFPEYRSGQIIKANNNKWIKITPIDVSEMKHLASFDFILVFPYGLRLTPEQHAQLIEAGKKGTSVFRVNRPDGINNLAPKHLDAVSEYLKNQCSQNYNRFLNYIRREIEGKKLFSSTIEPARELSVNSLFYKDDDAIFDDLESFISYCRDNKLHKEGAKKIVIFAGMPGPFDTGREQYTKIIEAFEQKGYNVFPISGYEKRKEYMQEISPDAVLYFPVGRFSSTANLDVTDFLKEQNIPVFCPLGLYSLHDEWLKNDGRMHIVMSGQRIVSPELDGSIVPYAVSAQYRDEDGYVVFDAIPERLPKFTNLVDNFVSLRQKQNEDKKVAILYYKGPGKNAMGGSGIEGIPSLYNTLLKLQQEGYTIDGLPTNYEDFRDLLNTKGKVFGVYAKGAFDDYVTSGYPQLIPIDKYTNWCKDILEQEMWQAVLDKYGQPEDGFMVNHTDSADFIAVSRIRFGNVTILPIPMAGYGDNEFKIIHGTEMPPPHAYLASYFWLQKGFQADAVIHFGTHGSLEFLHGKPVALSPYDWPDPLIGTMPHFYFYNISVVGEGIIAKRRSYATLLSHLTPPFMEAEALKESELQAKLSKYEHTEGALKEQYALTVKKLVVNEGIHIDLSLDDDLSKPYSEDEMLEIEKYLDEIGREKVTGNQYVIGQAYNKEETEQTTRLMKINSLSYNLARIDELKGKITHADIEDNLFFSKNYIDKSNQAILKVLKGASPTLEFNSLVSQTDYEKASSWHEKTGEQVNDQELMQVMMKMAGESKTSRKKMPMQGTIDNNKSDTDHLKELIVKITAQPSHKAFIEKLRSEEEFIRASAFLDPSKKAGLQKMARLVPAMKEALEIAEDTTVKEVLTLMQTSKTKEQVFTLLQDEGLEGEVELQKAKNDSLLLQKVLRMPYISVVSLTTEKLKKSSYGQITKMCTYLEFYEKHQPELKTILKKTKSTEGEQLQTFLETKLNSLLQNVHKEKVRIEQHETTFANAVFNVRNTLLSLSDTRQQLATSPQAELDAMINALNGGYIPASPGGDPVATPEAVPTGRNLYSVNVTATPTKEAWEVGKHLGKNMLNDYLKKHGEYPRKVSFTLWAGSFIESEGTTIAEIFYMLGAEPVWGRTGSVTDVRLIPTQELNRPRIDVIIQTSGQFRDLGDSRLFLIQKAIEMAALDKETKQNFIAESIHDAEKRLIEKGFSPKEARELSTSRIFGGVNNSYGSGIMDMVESGGSWDSISAVAQTYIHNMGSVYGKEESWSDFREGVFEAALLNTDAVVQPRQSNTWGPLSLDHVYEFMGGINLAVKEVTGKDAESYFNDYRNASHAKVQNLQQAIWAEARTTILNPKYIKEKMKGEASAAEDFAEVFRNSFGWNVMKPGVIDNQLWDKYYEVYIEDKLHTGIDNFFKDKNPYAYQEMTAIMLETIRKKLWNASPEQLKALAELHTRLVNDYEAGCSGFVCDNAKLQHFIENQIENSEQKEKYAGQISNVREVSTNANNESIILRKEKQKNVFTNLKINSRWIFIGFAFVLVLLIVFIKRRRR